MCEGVPLERRPPRRRAARAKPAPAAIAAVVELGGERELDIAVATVGVCPWRQRRRFVILAGTPPIDRAAAGKAQERVSQPVRRGGGGRSTFEDQGSGARANTSGERQRWVLCQKPLPRRRPAPTTTQLVHVDRGTAVQPPPERRGGHGDPGVRELQRGGAPALPGRPAGFLGPRREE